MLIDLEQLELEELTLLKRLGEDDILQGIKILIHRFIKKDRDINLYASANEFINNYLERGTNQDKITVKDLHEQYCESTDIYMGKKAFNRLLESYGYCVKSGSGNKLTVFNVISNWI